MAFLASTICGCAPSMEKVRAQPVRFEHFQDVPYERMANCITEKMLSPWSPTQLVDTREQTARIIILPLAEFTVKAVGQGSVVQLRQVKLVADIDGFERSSQEAVERCASQ
jgi:hypothetical protein